MVIFKRTQNCMRFARSKSKDCIIPETEDQAIQSISDPNYTSYIYTQDRSNIKFKVSSKHPTIGKDKFLVDGIWFGHEAFASLFHSSQTDLAPWIAFDFGETKRINKIRIVNRFAHNYRLRFDKAQIRIGNTNIPQYRFSNFYDIQ